MFKKNACVYYTVVVCHNDMERRLFTVQNACFFFKMNVFFKQIKNACEKNNLKKKRMCSFNMGV